MANLKEIRNRISSVSSTKQITSAMKMVSAAKLRKAQNAFTHLKPYAEKITEVLQHVTSSISDMESISFAQTRPLRRILFVVISSNRGLCGAFNSNVIKKLQSQIDENYQDLYAKANIEIITIGKRAQEALQRRNFKVVQEYNHIYEELTYANTVKITNKLMQLFTDKDYDRIEIVYNSFRNVAIQELICEQFLPFKFDAEAKVKGEYIFEPNRFNILEKLIPQVLSLVLYKAILDSNTSEHGARMTAMHKATDNATEMIKDLKLTYNKARQAAITKEILEIVGGAEALNG